MVQDDSSLPPEDSASTDGTRRRPADGGPWIPDLASLTRTGQISERVLAQIPWNRGRDQAGSWLDPLFQGPAPIAEVQGLGDRYVQLQMLGEGAAGTVFKAFDTLLQRWVALKVLKAAWARALPEARAQAQVEHPNVCRVYEVGHGFIIMQLVEGPTLAKLSPVPDLRTKVSYLRDIALGVHAAHQRGLLHLDLKLNNILMQDNGDGTFTPLLTDFGMVVNSTEAPADTCPMGTPPYSSPEQLAGDFSRIGPATDVYALGVMAYILLSGHSPFRPTGIEELLSAMAQEEPVPLERNLPGVPADLARLIHTCLRKDPARRCATPGELALELDRFLHQRPLDVMAGALPYRALRLAQRNRFTAWAALLGTLALALTVGAGWWRESRIAQQMDWDRHFQKRVEEARVIMDRAYREPPHDLGPETAQVKAIEDAIMADMKRHGRLLAGPGHLALGQLAAISDFLGEEAAQHFKAAWNSGFRTEGTRTWLAFSMIREYQESVVVPWWKQSTQEFGTPEELRQHYLEPARLMLRGRGDVDQSRLTHMVDQMEIQLASPDTRTLWLRLLDLETAYRRRAPQDLDALVAELNARLHQIQTELGDGAPGRASPATLAHWKAFRSLLKEGDATAPSHPGINAVLTSAAQLALDYPFLEPGFQGSRMAHLRACADRALVVSPGNPRMLAAKVDVLVRQVLEGDLPMARFQADMKVLVGPFRESAYSPLMALLALVPSGAWRDQDLLSSNLDFFATQGGLGSGQSGWLCAFILSQSRSLQGQDPRPVIRVSSPEARSSQPWTLAMIEAVHLVKAGRAKEIDLGRLDAAYAQEFASYPPAVVDLLEAARVRALARGTGEDWAALDKAFLHAPDPPGARKSHLLDPFVWFDCGLLLAEHAGRTGQDPGIYLAPVSAAIRGIGGSDRKERVRRAILEARSWLVRDRIGQGGAADLRNALAGLDRVLELFGGRIPFKDLDWYGTSLPGHGPLLTLRAELRTRLARSLRGPGRIAAARATLRDVEAALRFSPDYLPRLLPLKEEALGLLQGGPTQVPHAPS
jgi:hypothetical protein